MSSDFIPKGPWNKTIWENIYTSILQVNSQLPNKTSKKHLSVYLYKVNGNLVTWPPHPLIKCTSFVPNTKKGGRAHWTEHQSTSGAAHAVQLINKRASDLSASEIPKCTFGKFTGSIGAGASTPDCEGSPLKHAKKYFLLFNTHGYRAADESHQCSYSKTKNRKWLVLKEEGMKTANTNESITPQKLPIHVYTQWRAAGYTVLQKN